MSEINRARAGFGLEVASFAAAVWIAAALSRDVRATAVHLATVWTAAAIAAVPPVRFAVRRRGAVAVDGVAAVAILGAILGCFTIGGLALLIPVALLAAAGVLHHLTSPQAAKVMGLEAGRPQLVAAVIVGPLGAFLGLSMTAVAFAGWALSLVAIGLFGSVFSSRRRRRGKSPVVGWMQAIGIVLAFNVAAFVLAVSLVAIF